MAKTIAGTFDLASERGIAEFTRAMRGMRESVLGPAPVTRAERVEIGRPVVRDLIAEYGGTGGVARALGFERGTREYSNAVRSIQRHATGGAEQRSIGADWQARYRQIAPAEDRGKLDLLAHKPADRRKLPAGRLVLHFRGKIRVSSKSRNRSMPGGRAVEPIKRRYVLETFADPMSGFAKSYGISQDWGADPEQPNVQVYAAWVDTAEDGEEYEEEEEEEGEEE